MLAHRLRRWPNIVPTLAEHLVFSGRSYVFTQDTLKRTPSAVSSKGRRM